MSAKVVILAARLWTVALAGGLSASALAAGLPSPLLHLYERLPRVGLVADQPRNTEQPDPAYPFLEAAYEALRNEDLDKAVEGFLKGIELSPQRIDIRKDVAYTYLRMGEYELARRQFERVAQLDARDFTTVLELAFLDYDAGTTALKAEARRLFVRVAAEGNADQQRTARSALEFIDAQTAISMAPFVAAVRINPADIFSQYRVGLFREERNEDALALEAYDTVRRLGPSVVVDVAAGRVLLNLGRTAEAVAILRAAITKQDNLFYSEEARELLSKSGVI